MMKKTGLCLLVLVLMASSFQIATTTKVKVPTGSLTGAAAGLEGHPASEKAAAKVSGVRAKVSGIRERLASKKEAGKNHSSLMDGAL